MTTTIRAAVFRAEKIMEFNPSCASSPKRGRSRTCLDVSCDISKVSLGEGEYDYDAQIFEDYVPPTGAELERQIEEAWRGWVPPHGPANTVDSRVHRREAPPSARNAGAAGGRPEDEIELVEGARPQHTFVPKWVYVARASNRQVWLQALRHYFKTFRWPKFTGLSPHFMRACFAQGVTPDKYQRTPGFAPVWLFFLKELVQERKVEHAWFDACISDFFQAGRFPDFASLPPQLHDMCRESDIGEHHFFAVIGG